MRPKTNEAAKFAAIAGSFTDFRQPDRPDRADRLLSGKKKPIPEVGSALWPFGWNTKSKHESLFVYNPYCNPLKVNDFLGCGGARFRDVYNDMGYDGNLARDTMQAWSGSKNRSAPMWENRSDLAEIVRWKFGRKYDESEARNTWTH